MAIFDSKNNKLTAISYEGNDVKILELDKSLAEDGPTTIWRKPLDVTLNCSYKWENGDSYSYTADSEEKSESSKSLVLPYGTKLWVTEEEVLTDDADAQTAKEKPYYGSDTALKSLILHIDYSEIAEHCKINDNPALSFFNADYKADITGAYECLAATKIDGNDKLGYIASIKIGNTDLVDYYGPAIIKKAQEDSYYIVEEPININIEYKVRYREYRVAVGLYSAPASQDSYVCYDDYFELFGGQQASFTPINPRPSKQVLNENSSNNFIEGIYIKPKDSHTTKTGSSLGTTAGKTFTNNVETYLKPGTDGKPYRSDNFGGYVRNNTLGKRDTSSFELTDYNSNRKCYFISYSSTDDVRWYQITVNSVSGKTDADGLVVGATHTLYARAFSTCSVAANQTSVDNESWLFKIDNGDNVLFSRAAQPNMYTYNTVTTSTTSPESFRDIIGTNKALWTCQSGQYSWSFTPSKMIASNWAHWTTFDSYIYLDINNNEITEFASSNLSEQGQKGFIGIGKANTTITAGNYVYVSMEDGSGLNTPGTYSGYLYKDGNNTFDPNAMVSMRGKVGIIPGVLGKLAYSNWANSDSGAIVILKYWNTIPAKNCPTKPVIIDGEFYIKIS